MRGAWHARGRARERLTYDPCIAVTTCRRCGARAEAAEDSVPLGWSTSGDRDVIEALCAACTRAHVRDIEAKLDEQWWAPDRRER